MEKKSIFAISLLICIPLLMSTCSFTPLEVERPAQPTLDNIVTGVTTDVRIRNINLVPTGARSAFGSVVNEAEITFGSMTFNSVTETTINFGLCLADTEGNRFGTLTRTMYLSNQVAVVNGDVLPVFTGTEKNSSLDNAVLVEVFNRNITTPPCQPIPPLPNPDCPFYDYHDYDVDMGMDLYEGALIHECEREELRRILEDQPSINLLLADLNRGSWRVELDNGNFADLRHDCERGTILITWPDGSIEEVDQNDCRFATGIEAVPLSPVKWAIFFLLLYLFYNSPWGPGWPGP